MSGDGSRFIAGAPNHCHGRAFIPIARYSVFAFGSGAAITVEPLGIYVVDDEIEYYYPLAGDEPDFEAVERLTEILQKERKQPVG
ncbi:MAG: hypothetical protein QCH35_02795 [Methanomicrobiaceae archaeon]|nr:hypothetical protein [Methanomicrobiaceae archaeon]